MKDEIGKLIRLAGRRKAVSVERTARVRSAVREHWQAEVKARRQARLRFRWGMAALASAALIVVAIGLSGFWSDDGRPVADGAPILVETLTGSAWTRVTDAVPARTVVLEAGTELPFGSELVTGDDGRVSIRLETGHTVRLDTDGVLRLVDSRTFLLEQGAVFVDSGSSATSVDPIWIRTPIGTVHELGTQYEVRLTADSVRVRVREGAVILRHKNVAHQVGVASELILESDGSVTLREIPIWGPEWTWVGSIAPMLDLEGVKAVTFLEWIAREQGLTLVFADDSVLRQARKIELGGSIQGLTLDQALEVVLPTCRLTHRVDDGALIVEKMQDND